MNSRYLGAVIIAPIILFLFVGSVYLKYLVMILSIIGMHEFYNSVKKNGINSLSKLGYLICIMYYFYVDYNANYKFIFLALIIISFILMCIPVVDSKYNFIDIATTIFGFIYVGVFFSFIVAVDNLKYGNYFVWLIFIASWICDTAAYYSGKLLGKKKLCPRLSPKKTIEGSIGGIIGSIISCTLFGIFSTYKGVPLSIYHYAVIGLFCGILSQFGDLFASSIKRHAGVKDYGNLIPGHGGILDRFDSILFSAVVVYYYLIIVNLI